MQVQLLNASMLASTPTLPLKHAGDDEDKAPPRAKKRLETGARATAVTVRQKDAHYKSTRYEAHNVLQVVTKTNAANQTHIENAAAKGEQRQSSVASRISERNAPPLYVHQRTNKHTHTHTHVHVCVFNCYCMYLVSAPCNTHTHTYSWPSRRLRPWRGRARAVFFFFPFSGVRRVRSGRLRSAQAQRAAGCFLFCVSLLLCAKARAPQTRLLLQSDNTSGDV